MNSDHSLFKLDRIREWILARHPQGADVGIDIDLIRSGLVDSVSFVEYVLVIEDVCGQEIEINESILERVRTLRNVAENFLGDG